MTQRRIYSFISRTAIISMLLLLATTATAKKKQAAKGKANTTVKADSIPFLRGVAVSADMIGLAEMALGSHGQYEAQLRVNLKDKYFPVVEIGYGTADADEITTGLKYKTSAPYARVGMDFNIARNKHDDYRIYVGARYAMTDYKFDVSSDVIKDPVWGDEVEHQGQLPLAGSGVRCRRQDMGTATTGMVGTMAQAHSPRQRHYGQHMVCAGIRQAGRLEIGGHVQRNI